MHERREEARAREREREETQDVTFLRSLVRFDFSTSGLMLPILRAKPKAAVFQTRRPGGDVA